MKNAASQHVLMPSTLPHHVSNEAEVLQNIADPVVNLSLWQRPPQPAIAEELSVLRARQLPDVRVPTTMESFDDDICTHLRQHGLNPAGFEHFRADLQLLADHFAGVSGGRDLKFRLVTTDDDNCRRFHVDTRHMRMLCTYRGPGTEWLTDDQVDREALLSGAPNEAVIRFGQPSHFEPFWVGIFRGETGSSGNGLVHRSPPIEGSGQTRVLFCLDAEPLNGYVRAPKYTSR